MPNIPKEGVNLKCALAFRRKVIYSFRKLAWEVKHDSKYSQIRAVCGISALFSFNAHTGGVRMMQLLGFVVLPYHKPLGRFGLLWENIFSWWLIWVYNETSLHSRHFLRLR